MTTKVPCTIHILGRALSFHCEEKEIDRIERAGLLLDAKMRELRDAHNIVSSERLAIFAGLLLAQNVLSLEDEKHNKHDTLIHDLKTLNHKINQTLNNHEQISMDDIVK